MMKNRKFLIVVILLITILLMFCNRQGVKEGWVYEYHPNGNRAKLSFYEDDKLQGLVQAWIEEGDLIEEKFYQNDTLKWEKEYSKANRFINSSVKNIIYLSKEIYNYSDDSVRIIIDYTIIPRNEYEYTNGRKSGVWTYWHDNGVKRREVRYKYLEKDTFSVFTGITKSDKPYGVFSSSVRRSPRDGYSRFWYENGHLKREEYYNFEKKDSIWTYYSPSGYLVKKEIWDNNKLINTIDY